MKFWYSFWPGLIVIMGLAAMRLEWWNESYILFFFAACLLAWLAVADIWERSTANNYSKADLAEKRAEFARSVVNLSYDDKALLGIEWEDLEIDFIGHPTLMLRGTNILLLCFQKFLADSTDTDFASLHWYNDDKSLQNTLAMSRDAVRHQWHLTVAYLAERGLLTKNSAQGNHSYKWMKGGRKRMLNWYGAVKTEDYVNLHEVEA